mgnify:CR=1 FL=1
MFTEIFNITNTNKLLDSIYNSIVITDEKLEGPDHPKILYVNRSFEKFTGYTADEVLGKTPRILQGEKTQREVLDRLKETLLKGEFFEGNTVNYKKDGTAYYVEWNITPIKNRQGEVTNYFCVQKDITREVQDKQYLENRVEEEVKKRKHQEQINQKQAKMAAMGEMIDAIAHQWKQPVGIIKLNVQMLEYDLEDSTNLQKTYYDFQEKIESQIKHMENTLNEFRSFLRTDKQLTCFYIKDVVDKVLFLIKDEFIKHQIEVSTNISQNLYIYGYENEFKHVLLNILNNSKDAFEEKNIKNRKIHITGTVNDNSNALSICDNAKGIDEEKIARIFEPEFTTKSPEKGTGIGLYMSKQILDKFHATIQANNQNNGICFNINWVNIHDF